MKLQADCSLSSLIKAEILLHFSSMADFSKTSGINRSLLSLMFRSREPKPISFEQLIKITTALGYPEKYFFNLYIEEYFIEGSFNRSRIENLLYRCGELGLIEHLDQATSQLDGQSYYIPVVFEVAERLHQLNRNQSALFLYNWIIESGSEIPQMIVSTCHYRIFRSGILIDSDSNLQLLYRFLPYRSHLPAYLKLDALLNVNDILYDQQQYEEQIALADELILLCIELFGTEDCVNRENIASYTSMLPRHPVVYYGRGYLLKYAGLECMQRYEEAQGYLEKYSSLTWFDDGSPIAQEEISKLTIFSIANAWNLELLRGNSNILPEYVAFLEQHPREVLPSMITILDAANTFGFSVDEFLETLEKKLDESAKDTQNYYSKNAQKNNLSYVLYHLAIYHFNAGRIQKSLDTATQCWNSSQEVNNKRHIKLLASLTALYNLHSSDD